jgi:hypothetical protein
VSEILIDTTGFRLWDEDPKGGEAVAAEQRWLGFLHHLSPSSLGMFRRC